MGNTLLTIVHEWLAENGKSESQRDRIYTIAISGLRELHLDVNGIIKTAELCVNDNDTVDLPNDFINYRKIGILGGDGQIHCLGKDNAISLQPACGVEGRRKVRAGSDYLYNNSPFLGAFYGFTLNNGGVFGIGGGNNVLGYYRIDKKTNQIWLTNLRYSAKQSIIIEYIGDIETVDGDFVVSSYAIQTIKSWIDWKYKGGEDKRRDYYNELKKTKKRIGGETIEEWGAAFRKSNTATVRF